MVFINLKDILRQLISSLYSVLLRFSPINNYLFRLLFKTCLPIHFSPDLPIFNLAIPILLCIEKILYVSYSKFKIFFARLGVYKALFSISRQQGCLYTLLGLGRLCRVAHLRVTSYYLVWNMYEIIIVMVIFKPCQNSPSQV